MSSSIAIPQRKRAAGSMDWSSAEDSASSSYSGLITGSHHSAPSSSSKGKAAVSSSPSSPSDRITPRRPSLLGSSLAKSEHIVVDLAHADGPPRLVTCVKSSQGFDWNQELFLPSYANHDAQDLEQRSDPVQDIILTDEEAAAMLPQ